MRSKHGCDNCRQKHRKCDEEHPACRNCTARNLVCQGYNRKLRWRVTNVSSRDRTKSAISGLDHVAQSAPDQSDSNIPLDTPNVRGHYPPLLEDEIPESEKRVATRAILPFPDRLRILDRALCDCLEQETFDKWLASGHERFTGVLPQQNPLSPLVHQSYHSSVALVRICITLQTFLDEEPSSCFLGRYQRALAAFRNELSSQSTTIGIGIILAGIILCTVEILQGSTWTVHLDGIIQLATSPTSMLLDSVHSSDFIPVVETIGLLDMPIFVIGRRCSSQQIWRRYRSGQFVNCLPPEHPQDMIEPVSGLPKTLLDIFAADSDPQFEQKMWHWPGFSGSPLQCQLWEAYRCAGILDIRQRRRHSSVGARIDEDALPFASPSQGGLNNVCGPPATDSIMLSRALSALEAIYTALVRVTDFNRESFVMSAVNYPLFVVALYEFSSESRMFGQETDRTTMRWFQTLKSVIRSMNLGHIEALAQEIGTRRKSGDIETTADQLAFERHWEVALF